MLVIIWALCYPHIELAQLCFRTPSLNKGLLVFGKPYPTYTWISILSPIKGPLICRNFRLGFEEHCLAEFTERGQGSTFLRREAG